MTIKEKIRAIANERLPERLKLGVGAWFITNKGVGKTAGSGLIRSPLSDSVYVRCTEGTMYDVDKDIREVRGKPVTLQEVLLMLYQKWNYKNQKTILVDVYKLSVMKIKCFSNNNKQETYLKGEKISEKTVSIVEGVIKYDLTKSVKEQSEETLQAIYKLIK